MTTLPIAKRSPELTAYLAKLKADRPTPAGRARLIFALDATASRQPTWDRACQIQGEMFEATTAIGGLQLQLVYYRGADECKASRWLSSATELRRAMTTVLCAAGITQIGRVLTHAIREAAEQRIGALVFVGDAMEEKEEALASQAGELGRLGVPMFIFHEIANNYFGDESSSTAAAFRVFAARSGGAYCTFDLASADRLKTLLGAVAVYAAGGHPALTAYGRQHGAEIRQLTAQLGRRQ